jgi:hypothetical protein
MDTQEQPSAVEAGGADVAAEIGAGSQDGRLPWQTPEVTRMEIKRTMNSSGQGTDGITSAPLPG